MAWRGLIVGFGFAALFTVAVLGAGGCPATPPECSAPADCAPLQDAACSACAPLATELCIAGACAARGDDAVTLSATVSIDRSVDGVNGLRFVAVRADPFSCEAVASAADPSWNVLSSGQLTLTGGDFHPGVGLGRVPVGEVAVVAWATADAAGQGAVLGSACVEPRAVDGEAADLGTLTVGP